ncbi:D-2-hydroxyacid dehydrogenase [Alkalilimnicola sp. S0819]|uniref:D-2-hydroxyacid dehydrogenase n=1 Tax=Alkalilimnicola sp. S0819 TaxID=2613922 RepID=UPI0012615CB2|nr:D-2-hydroxyacid dehydrogenase [Alkalilimnicola sp. S0819]KAB7623725.1 D-2-hydroxyacid dehydrogenase [Alkalilimnicola sp. S0819]MPQ16854.1 D-2-hydroxyacid dehydrogenase [Alkalilimnicola sp. S0819]
MQDSMPHITVLHAPDEGPPPGLDQLRGEAHITLADNEEALAAAVPETEILLVTDFRTPLLRKAWSEARRLRWMHATSAGVDALLFPENRDSDIPITNARGVFDHAIAETVLGMMLMFAKDFLGSLALKREARWQHRDTERLSGKRLLVVGAGSIGREIARLAGLMDMRVEGIARRARPADADFAAIHPQGELHEHLAHADYVVVAAPLTPETEGLFDERAFAAMRPHARFINIGRGAIVRTEALVAALREERLAGAGLDVFEQEPLPPEHPLWAMPQVFMSAHMAGDFLGWREALIEQFVENFRRWQAGEPLRNVVDKTRGYVTGEHG